MNFPKWRTRLRFSLVLAAAGLSAAAGCASGEFSASRGGVGPAPDAASASASASAVQAGGKAAESSLLRSSLEWGELQELFGRRPVGVIPLFADERATAVWTSGRRIWTRHTTRTGVWKAARSVPHHVRSPGLIGAASDADGALTLVGKTSPRGDRYRIYSWCSRRNGSWTRPQLLASGSTDEDLGTAVDMSVNSRGAILVTWIEPTTLKARALYRPSGGPWSKPVTFRTPSLFEGIRGTVGPGGQAVVTYPNSTGKVVAVRRINGRWMPPTVLPVRPSPPTTHDIDQASSRKSYLVWRTNSGTIRVGTITARGWRSSRVATNVAAAWDVQITANADGGALALWTQGPFAAARPFSMHGVRRHAGGPWQAPEVLVPQAVSNAPEVVSNPRGDVLLSWLGPGLEGATYDVEPYVMFLARGSSSYAPVDIGAGTGSNTGGGTPPVALARDSRALVVWQSLVGPPSLVDWGPTLLRSGYPVT